MWRKNRGNVDCDKKPLSEDSNKLIAATCVTSSRPSKSLNLYLDVEHLIFDITCYQKQEMAMALIIIYYKWLNDNFQAWSPRVAKGRQWSPRVSKVQGGPQGWVRWVRTKSIIFKSFSNMIFKIGPFPHWNPPKSPLKTKSDLSHPIMGL